MATNFILHMTVLLLIFAEGRGTIEPRRSVIGLWSAMVAGLSTLFLVNWRYHWRDYWRLATPERQSGTIVLGLIAGVTAFAHGAMGSSRVMLFGLAFFPLSILFALLPVWSPLIFALASAAILGVMYLEIKRATSPA